jgi:hypothetical protein
VARFLALEENLSQPSDPRMTFNDETHRTASGTLHTVRFDRNPLPGVGNVGPRRFAGRGARIL